MKRAIQKYVEDKITDAIINEDVKVGDRISLRYDKDADDVKIVKLVSKDKGFESDDLLTEQIINNN